MSDNNYTAKKIMDEVMSEVVNLRSGASMVFRKACNESYQTVRKEFGQLPLEALQFHKAFMEALAEKLDLEYIHEDALR